MKMFKIVLPLVLLSSVNPAWALNAMTMDQVCTPTVQTEKYGQESAQREKLLKAELAYFQSAKSLYSELYTDAKGTFLQSSRLASGSAGLVAAAACMGVCGIWTLGPIGGSFMLDKTVSDYIKLQEKDLLFPRTKAQYKKATCTDGHSALLQIRKEMGQIHENYFSGSVADYVKNLAFGFRQMRGTFLLSYYASMGERLAKNELAIIGTFKQSQQQQAASLLKIADGSCAGKKIEFYDNTSSANKKALAATFTADGATVQTQDSELTAWDVPVMLYSGDAEDKVCATKIADYMNAAMGVSSESPKAMHVGTASERHLLNKFETGRFVVEISSKVSMPFLQTH